MGIDIVHLSRRFGHFTVLDDLSCHFPDGELVALLGPSGCGKTTLLRIIAGLDHADAGEVRIAGHDVASVRARERRVGFVFQHYALFRHMTIFENVAFGLRVKPRRERLAERPLRDKVHGLLALVQLDWLAEHYPPELSGGQRQRVALARALAIEPRVLLLDEPFGALDAKVRKELRNALRHLHDALNVTTLFVTHDQDEALEVADRIVLLNQGRIEQTGSPQQLYDRPANAFVCEFLGAANRVPGQVTGQRFVATHASRGAGVAVAADFAGPALAYIRPHDLHVERPGAPADGLPVTVRRITPAGATVRVTLDTVDGTVLEAQIERSAWAVLGLTTGARTTVTLGAMQVFPAAARETVSEPAAAPTVALASI